MSRKLTILILVVIAATLIISACSNDSNEQSITSSQDISQQESQVDMKPAQPDPSAAEGKLPEVDPFTISGDIIMAGSSTVFPLAESLAERFADEGFEGNITIDSIGSGAGFERFCVNGETDITNASRAIKDSERGSCLAIGREAIEFRVGTDAVAIIVSKDNGFLTDVSMEQLAQIFSTATLWSDINPDWPTEPILRYIPGTDSGTFDYFVEEVFAEEKEPILNASNLNMSEDDNVLVQGVLGSPFAVGFFGFAYYQENASNLNALSIDGVLPNAETAENGDYPLARPLFIYSDAAIMKEKPQVAAFINFFLTYVNEEILDVGYFQASEEALQNSKDAWLEAMQ